MVDVSSSRPAPRPAVSSPQSIRPTTGTTLLSVLSVAVVVGALVSTAGVAAGQAGSDVEPETVANDAVDGREFFVGQELRFEGLTDPGENVQLRIVTDRNDAGDPVASRTVAVQEIEPDRSVLFSTALDEGRYVVRNADNSVGQRYLNLDGGTPTWGALGGDDGTQEFTVVEQEFSVGFGEDEAAVVVSDVTLSNTAVTAGGTVTVSAVVTSDGATAASTPVQLYRNDTRVNESELDVDGDTNATVTFEARTDGLDAGTYVYAVVTESDSASTTLTVETASVEGPTDESSSVDDPAASTEEDDPKTTAEENDQAASAKEDDPETTAEEDDPETTAEEDDPTNDTVTPEQNSTVGDRDTRVTDTTPDSDERERETDERESSADSTRTAGASGETDRAEPSDETDRTGPSDEAEQAEPSDETERAESSDDGTAVAAEGPGFTVFVAVAGLLGAGFGRRLRE